MSISLVSTKSLLFLSILPDPVSVAEFDGAGDFISFETEGGRANDVGEGDDIVHFPHGSFDMEPLDDATVVEVDDAETAAGVGVFFLEIGIEGEVGEGFVVARFADADNGIVPDKG